MKLSEKRWLITILKVTKSQVFNFFLGNTFFWKNHVRKDQIESCSTLFESKRQKNKTQQIFVKCCVPVSRKKISMMYMFIFARMQENFYMANFDAKLEVVIATTNVLLLCIRCVCVCVCVCNQLNLKSVSDDRTCTDTPQ